VGVIVKTKKKVDLIEAAQEAKEQASTMSAQALVDALTNPNTSRDLTEQQKKAYNARLLEIQEEERAKSSHHQILKYKEGDEPVKHERQEEGGWVRKMFAEQSERINATNEKLAEAIASLGASIKELKDKK
jgi:hypothetical protein